MDTAVESEELPGQALMDAVSRIIAQAPGQTATPLQFPTVDVVWSIYVRISKDAEGKKLGVNRQEKLCRKALRSLGGKIGKVYCDNDLSAYSGKLRPEYRQMLKDIEAGLITGVVVYDLDRLHRLPIELEEFFNVCDKAGVTSLVTATGAVDLATAEGRMVARIMGAVARKSSDDTSRRLKDMYEDEAGKGLPHGSRAFGYGSDRVTIDETEAAVVREMIEMLFAGESARGIARALNDRSITTRDGKQWYPSTVKHVIVNPRNAGLRTHRGKVVSKGVWEPIIDMDTYTRVVATFDDPGRKTSKLRRRRLLTGLMFCGKCGGRMFYVNKDNVGCRVMPGTDRCGGVTLLASRAEPEILARLFARLKNVKVQKPRAAKTDEGEVWTELANVEAKMKSLTRLYAADSIGEEEWVEACRGIRERRAAAHARLATLTQAAKVEEVVEDTHLIQSKWETFSIDRQRQILARYIERVTIRPTGSADHRKFDADRIVVDWKV